ncbi:BsuPI-related putative proteinase inhibitor [Halorubrum kocurii]|uniref:Intracellular proteinase inhibitor BsuPI domain-containing protein n=1 Tax=Halorubrum kocurii JCM 14978 TaxID=1230456 RepID=M0NMX1_9EURY|nr:BsuPI-related putative proteinase inhibitor [Halorubrum kocurii]EMA58948.1 hypothetical protein C468_14942 [Halorubrum kocurii JCM 14978]
MLDVALSMTDDADAGNVAGIGLALTVRNAGESPETLRFRTGQRADFAAYRIDGEGGADEEGGEADPVWRYGTDRLFTQVLGSETLEPGDSTTYKATWGDPPPGRYRIVGEVTAEGRDLSATATAAVD